MIRARHIAASAAALFGASCGPLWASTPAEGHVLRYQLSSPESPAAPADRQIAAFTSAPDGVRDAEGLLNLLKIEGIQIDPSLDEGVLIRRDAIREVGTNAGINAGLDWRYKQIREALEANATYLETVFNFSRLLIDGMVMPPVIDRAENLKRKVDDNTAAATGVQYVLAADARIVTEAPNWRDFLIKDFGVAPAIPRVALPKNKAEKEIWTEAVNEGWDIGIRHADDLFDAHLNLLTKTYRGMLTFSRLEAEGIVTMPQLARSDLGVVRDGRTLNINDRLYRITAPTEFGDEADWRVIPRDAP